MKSKKTVLIVYDEADSTQKMAEEIAACLAGNKVVSISASAFSPTDLLPADICFLGCEKPRPASFAALEKFLSHVNLAGRSCALFTAGRESAVTYLRGIVKASEIRLIREPCAAGKSDDVKVWVKTVLHES